MMLNFQMAPNYEIKYLKLKQLLKKEFFTYLSILYVLLDRQEIFQNVRE